MFGKKNKDEDSTTSTVQVNLENTGDNTTTASISVEEPKKKKSKSKKPQEEPKLARDRKRELHATGTFFGGIASMKLENNDIELPRTQRIILEKNGVHYEYLRSKPPY